MLVIGLMSGTSLDGVDLALCKFNGKGNEISFEFIVGETYPYSAKWKNRLSTLTEKSALEYVATDHELGHLFGVMISDFIKKHKISPELISSHGHTIFHQPQKGFTSQIGHGAQIHAQLNLPVICDFRTIDVALGGQGAPLVPIGDELLFSNYDFCLNLGGISNISFIENNQRIAFDISPANMILNHLAEKAGFSYDKDGELAKKGNIIPDLLQEWNELSFYKQKHPKSLGKEWFEEKFLPILLKYEQYSVEDLSKTACIHISDQISNIILGQNKEKSTLLITGGGTYNKTLISILKDQIKSQTSIVILNNEIIDFKEAIIFGLLGYLKVIGQKNTLAPVTGAKADSIGGALYGSI